MNNNNLKLLSLLIFSICLIVTITCKKLEKLMFVSTGDVTNFSTNTADAPGEVIDIGDGANQHGHYYGKTSNLTDADLKTVLGAPSGRGSFTSQLTDLEAGTKYYVKAYISNLKETVYGKEISFTTSSVSLDVPTLTSTAASSITQNTAISGGNIISAGGAPIITSGVCWSTTTNPLASGNHTTDGTASGTFISTITGLMANTTYYIRAYATNSVGTAYGNQVSFTTNAANSTVTDIDGNIYNTMIIGTQKWMTENLKTTNFNDGSVIPLVEDGTEWGTLNTPGYCFYNNDAITNKDNYGALYNWYAVNTGKLCPTGWHVPTDAEWHTLALYLDPSAVLSSIESTLAGGKLKEAGTSHWLSPNTGATNESGFTALSGGFRNYNGTFNSISYSGDFWLATEFNATNAWSRWLAYNSGDINRSYFDKRVGNSVRCIEGQVAILPTVSTDTPNSISQSGATVGGNVASDGGAAVTDMGIYYGTSSNPETTGTKLQIGSGTGTFSTSLTGLTANTTYYIQAYATNSVGTVYGNEQNFTTSSINPVIPTLTTLEATAITQTTANSGGDITSNGGATITASGVCWSTDNNPEASGSHTTDGTTTGIFTSSITGLTSNTTYYARAYGTNSEGTAYGNQVSFTTSSTAVPTVATASVVSITSFTAICGGNVASDGGSPVTARGVCWSTSVNPTISDFVTTDGTGTGSFVSNISELTPGTTYYVSAYATTNNGTGYGSVVSFTAPTGLVAEYLFNGNANDESGNGNNGIVYGAVLSSDRFDNPNSAYLFDGVDDYIDIGNQVKPVLPFSVSIWIKADEHRLSYFFRNDKNNVDEYNGVSISTNDAGILAASVYEGGLAWSSNRYEKLTINPVITPGLWQHIIIVFGTGRQIDIYVNGVLQETIFGDGTGTSLGYSTNSGAIGSRQPTSNDKSFKGLIDDVRVYNRILTDTEIENLSH